MNACKWDRDAKDYLRDGEPCKRDEYGDPTRHCTGKRSCAQHVGFGEQTCARCIGRTRQDIRAIAELAMLMLPEALTRGVGSEAAMLAGPAADYGVFSARRTLDRQWLMAHIPERNLERAIAALLDDDDTWHPYSVLTRWHLMLVEDYRHPLPDRMSVAESAKYLDRTLHLMAQDEEQDFPLLRRELEKCRAHLETVLRNSTTPDRGAPCPECVDQGGIDPRTVRLRRAYGHWCEDADCERIHYADDSGDEWVCPQNRQHRWTHADYSRWVEERRARGA